MFKQGFDIAFKIVKILSILVAPVAVCIGIFALLCVSWFSSIISSWNLSRPALSR